MFDSIPVSVWATQIELAFFLLSFLFRGEVGRPQGSGAIPEKAVKRVYL